VARLLLTLNSSCLASVNCQVSFQEILAASDPPMNVPQVAPNSLPCRRGDARGDGVVNIVDAMFIAQYTVSLRTLGDLEPLNAASVRHDVGGDIINIVDAMFIAQYTVMLRDAFFNPL
jgi:hypothetical protein